MANQRQTACQIAVRVACVAVCIGTGELRMSMPDFARTETHPLADADVRFLIDHFPVPGRCFEDVLASVVSFPSTIESMLDSDFVVRRLLDTRELLLEVSPFLLFNVLLRQTLPGPRTRTERKVINYLANLLCLFIDTRRVYRIHAGEAAGHGYLWEMIAAAQQAHGERRFLILSHIGNYSLYLSGVFHDGIHQRQRHGRRSIGIDYYTDFGRAYFELAAAHDLARRYRLQDVFNALSSRFDRYQQALYRVREVRQSAALR